MAPAITKEETCQEHQLRYDQMPCRKTRGGSVDVMREANIKATTTVVGQQASGKPLPISKSPRSRRKQHFKSTKSTIVNTMLSILRKARLRDKEMRILMLSVD